MRNSNIGYTNKCSPKYIDLDINISFKVWTTTFMIPFILTSFLSLQGCAAAAVSGAATGIAMVHDRRTAGTFIDDQATEVKAFHVLNQNKSIRKSSHITPICYNNVLLLVGQVPSEDIKREAEDLVSDFPKIRKIHNELTVNDNAPLARRSQDTWITTQIKSRMLKSKKIDPGRVKVVTEDGTVF